MSEPVTVIVSEEQTRADLVRLGWIDNLGRSLDWKYWANQPKRYPFVWVLEEEGAESDE